MNRGRRGEDLFADKDDRLIFFELLKEARGMWNLRIAAYCLMQNHYHLLLQTPDANLSRSMRHIGGIYTQRYNRKHRIDGPLFRGRYKAILVDSDSYLLGLVRYIHRNPLRAGMVKKLEGYAWSSYVGYLSKDTQWEWLHKDFVLSVLEPDRNKRKRAYKKFMAEEDSEDIAAVFKKKKLPSVLGSDKFIEKIKRKYFAEKKDRNVPQSKELAPGIQEIKKAVCDVYKINEENLCGLRRGRTNEPRNAAVYLSRKFGGDNLERLGEEFAIDSYSTVSSILGKVSSQMTKDKKLRKKIEKIEKNLST
jgi:REP element-mobilizing transposase RayT